MGKDTKGKAARQSLSGREKGLVAAVCACAVVAVAGFALYLTTAAPSAAAAKVNDTYIAEEDVAEWIEQYRISYSLTDDDDFLTSLTSDDESASTFRISVINQLALNMLILEKAEELGVTPDDEDCQAQLDATKEALAFGDDDTWEETLESYGLTEEGLLEQYKVNLAEDAVCEAMVEVREADDDELLSYVQGYLAGTTQKHAYRIVFDTTTDDYQDRIDACVEELEALEEAGELDVGTFASLALSYSDAEDLDETGGSYAWSGGNMSDTAKEVLEDIEVGERSEAETVDGEDAVEIYFVDEDYTFDDASDLTELPDDVPDELMAEIEEAASEVIYESDCSSYLAYLLSQAQITYYPIPEDASYNVTVFDSD